MIIEPACRKPFLYPYLISEHDHNLMRLTEIVCHLMSLSPCFDSPEDPFCIQWVPMTTVKCLLSACKMYSNETV